MVRLSLIVLGLLAAVWCFTGAAEGVQFRRVQNLPNLSCGAGQVIKVEKCYKMKAPCSGPAYFKSDSVTCISGGARYQIFQKCTLKRSCALTDSIKKGPYACNYSCVKRPRSRMSCLTTGKSQHCVLG